MNLLTSMMERFVKINQTSVSDGSGGFDKGFTDGTSFMAAAVINTSNQTKTAEHPDLLSDYTITMYRDDVPLKYYDIVKRCSDGMIFRVTSNSSEHQCPRFGTLDIAQVTAERWELPDD